MLYNQTVKATRTVKEHGRIAETSIYVYAYNDTRRSTTTTLISDIVYRTLSMYQTLPLKVQQVIKRIFESWRLTNRLLLLLMWWLIR